MLLWVRTTSPSGGGGALPATNLLPPAPLTPNSTIYIGGLYEEDVTPGSTTTQYTSYYTLGGKLVSMRRVVGSTGSTGSTQYRIVGNHLGSTWTLRALPLWCSAPTTSHMVRWHTPGPHLVEDLPLSLAECHHQGYICNFRTISHWIESLPSCYDCCA
jgi:hypothetical protein